MMTYIISNNREVRVKEMDFQLLCMILISLSSRACAEQEILTVFRISRDIFYPGVQTEIHRLTNAIGLPLRTKNGLFIDSVEDMPSLKCSPANEGCEWTKSSNWIYSPVNVSEDENLSVNIDYDFNLHGYYKTCEDYNGGCVHTCSMEAGKPVCGCPASSIPAPVHIQVDSFICNSMERIHLSFVCDGDRDCPDGSDEDVWACNEFKPLNVFPNPDLLNGVWCSEAPHEIRNHLMLRGDEGSLSYEAITLVESLCLSVIYKTESNNGTLNMQISLLNGTKIVASKIQDYPRGEWMQKIFYVLVGHSNTTVRLTLEAHGKGTSIYSINSCSPYGIQDMTITGIISSLPKEVISSHEGHEGDIFPCANGGVRNWETSKCVCPAGFTGPNCLKGCGANSYGNDCSATCSADYDSGCSRMVFCKPRLPCLCAPGYIGENCDTKCEEGTYGINCKRECGKCIGNTCSIYTGACHNGCESGFYPPFCTEPYKYIKDAPNITLEDFNSVRILFDVSSTVGEGEMKYYQIQYMKIESEEKEWIATWSAKIDGREDIVSDVILGLLPGHKYSARVVLIDADGKSYQEERVPQTDFIVMCSVPPSTEYTINHTLQNSSFVVQWQYGTNHTDCPITNYTVVLKRKWHEIQTLTEKTHIVFANLIPSTEYTVKVKANMEGGIAPFSPWYVINTRGLYVPQYVTGLRAKPNGKKNLLVTWSPPKDEEKSIDKYIIQYKCVQYLACPEHIPSMDFKDAECNGDETEITVEANQTSASLDNLHSHAVYKIKVAAVSGDFTGPFTSIRGLTDDSEPDAAPTMSNNPVLSSTNTSVIVQWDSSDKCHLFNGYFAGYRYELLSPNKTMLYEGFTRHTNVPFLDLLPQTTYTMNVYLISSGGINRDFKITFNVSTKATVPSEVRDLTVYKRGRRLVGLRWKEPKNTYGEISSFFISHCQINGDCVNEVTSRVPPSSCSAWPDYYCYTINKHLHPNKRYSVTVKARNKNVDEDGNPAAVKTSTSEGVPEAPLELQVVNQTSQSVTIQWKPPFMFNGILRFFFVNVEHIDSANSTHCCDYFPLHEIRSLDERATYTYEVNGLAPASKYVIGISAKALLIGPSSTLTVNTAPEVPSFNAPEVTGHSVTVPSQHEFDGVTSTYLLIVIPEYNVDSKIYDSNVKEKLKELIRENFYVVDEFINDELPATVDLGTDTNSRNGTFGVLQNTHLPEKFRVGLALVLDYSGARNVGFLPSNDTVINS